VNWRADVVVPEQFTASVFRKTRDEFREMGRGNNVFPSLYNFTLRGLLFYPEDEGNRFLRKVRSNLLSNTASHTKN